ncbi:MAG: DUF202 domain-containing protein [Armatimonas sp.]
MVRNLSIAERARAARDPLAYERTILANERTRLAYIQTALAIFGTGIAFLEFAHLPSVLLAGWLLLPTGVIVLLVGMYSCRKSQQRTDENALGDLE